MLYAPKSTPARARRSPETTQAVTMSIARLLVLILALVGTFSCVGVEGQYDSTATTLTLEHIWPESGAVYESTTVSLYGSGYSNALPPIGCRFGEVVAAKDAASSTSTKIVCSTPTVFAGFVAVGLAQATGRKYVPGSDDLVVDNGQHSFEFVKPWKLSRVNPEFVYKTGGEVLRLVGSDFRPGMQCKFEVASLTSEFRFVSSALAMCETRASTSADGTVALSLTSDHAVGGTEVAMFYQTSVIIDGPVVSSGAPGSDVLVEVSDTTRLSDILYSFTSSPVRIGCWFDGIWVEGSLLSETQLSFKAPLTGPGSVSLSVVDMYAQRMFPTNSTQSGWYAFTITDEEVIDAIVPSSGTAMRSNVRSASETVEFYGTNLIAGFGSSAARLCSTLNPAASPVLVTGDVHSKCDFPSVPSETVALAALSYGFHAVSKGSASLTSAQYLIVSPPQITSVIPGYLREGSLATFTGQNMMDGIRSAWCTYDGIALEAHQVSSALLKCQVPLHSELPSGSVTTAHSLTLGVVGGQTDSLSAAGVSSVNWVPLTADLASIVSSLGSVDGGTRTVLKVTGGIIPASAYYTPKCRFGTISVSAEHVPGGGVVCSSPAHVAATVNVGIDEESAVTFEYVENVIFDVDSIVPAGLPKASGGNITLPVESTLCNSVQPLQCIFSTTYGPQWRSTAAWWSGSCVCKTPDDGGVGFAVMSVVVKATKDSSDVAFVDEAVGQYNTYEIQSITPAVDVFLPLGANWIQAEEIIHVTSSDGTLIGSGDSSPWCVFTQAGIYNGTTFYSQATFTSSTNLKCAVPGMDSLIASGQSGFDVWVSICVSTEYSASVCNANAGTRLRYEQRVLASTITPVNGTQDGGDMLTLYDASIIKSFGANIPSCRFGTIFPVAATLVTGTADLNCVSPAHIAGTVPVSVPPIGIGTTIATFTYLAIDTSAAALSLTYGTDTDVIAYLVDPTPMITEVSPWMGWSGSVVSLTGTNFPSGPDVRCRFGSVSVDAQVISTALIRCGGTVPVTSDPIEQQLMSVTTSDGSANANITTIQHYIVSKGDVSSVDAVDGWQEGGNLLAVKVATWSPEGYTSCLFGTISVQSRGGNGYGAIGKASVSQASQWWSSSSDETNVECVSPAQKAGTVLFGVSIAGTLTKSFDGNVTAFTYI